MFEHNLLTETKIQQIILFILFILSKKILDKTYRMKKLSQINWP